MGNFVIRKFTVEEKASYIHSRKTGRQTYNVIFV